MLRFDSVYLDEDIKRTRLQPGFANKLYKMLAARTEEQNISHKSMPTYEDHIEYIYSRPYKYWFLIWSDDDEEYIGNCYISNDNEIGIFILSDFQGYGRGQEALKYLLNREGPSSGPYFANVNPANARSISFFTAAGFKHIQNTYKLD